jgi:hypothetical protein
MFFSGEPPERNLDHLRTAGFGVVREQVVEQDEPGRRAPTRFHWVLARVRPSA